MCMVREESMEVMSFCSAGCFRLLRSLHGTSQVLEAVSALTPPLHTVCAVHASITLPPTLEASVTRLANHAARNIPQLSLSLFLYVCPQRLNTARYSPLPRVWRPFQFQVVLTMSGTLAAVLQWSLETRGPGSLPRGKRIDGSDEFF